MSFPKITEILSLDNDQIEKEILTAKKQLFELRLRQGTRQSFKPHTLILCLTFRKSLSFYH